MKASCLVFGCGDPVMARGRCAKHARQVDAARSIGVDRQAGRGLYGTPAWKELRAVLLALHPWCECAACVAGPPREYADLVHHVRPHGGDRQLFFDPANLQVLAASCHSRLHATGGWSKGAEVRLQNTAPACLASGRRLGLGAATSNPGGGHE
jgi:5-methylcytosine-specific restriction protein A